MEIVGRLTLSSVSPKIITVINIRNTMECHHTSLQRVPNPLPTGTGTPSSLLIKVSLFLLVNFSEAGNEINAADGDDLGLHGQFIANPKEEEHRNSNVAPVKRKLGVSLRVTYLN